MDKDVVGRALRKVYGKPVARIPTAKDYVKKAGKFPEQIRAELKAELKKGNVTSAYKRAGVHSFTGRIKNSSEIPGTGKKAYTDGTFGIFTQSTKGMPGKHYVMRAFDKTVGEYSR